MALKLIDGTEFLHVPKTGGSWVESVLKEQGLINHHLVGNGHADYDRILSGDRMGKSKSLMRESRRLTYLKLKRITHGKKSIVERQPHRFCFVRHPLSWYESFWKFMCGRGWNDWGQENSFKQWHPNAILNGLGSDDFNQFVRNVVEKRPGYVSEFLFAYTKPGVSYIGKNENLAEDLIQVLGLLGLPCDADALRGAKRVNVSKGGKGKIEWDPELKKTVTLLELPALTHFGYLTAEEADSLGISIPIPANKAVQASALVRSCNVAAK